MRRIPVRAAVLALAAVQLGGCSSFLGLNFARHSTPEAAPAAEASAPAFTEAGRRHLTQGQTGLAVETFQKALGSGEAQAPALNGLGVAFARLGRFDLAHRYFSQAMAIDPADTRYADNMTRLMRSPALATRRDADIAAQAQLAARTAAEPAVAAKPAVGQIQRLSRGEVRIVTAPPRAQPIARAAQNASAAGFKPIIRVAFADKQADESQDFVRIQLPAPKDAGPPNAAAPSASKTVSLP